ncbi:hypothetical protein AB1K42_24210 [Roseibium algicola]
MDLAIWRLSLSTGTVCPLPVSSTHVERKYRREGKGMVETPGRIDRQMSGLGRPRWNRPGTGY